MGTKNRDGNNRKVHNNGGTNTEGEREEIQENEGKRSLKRKLPASNKENIVKERENGVEEASLEAENSKDDDFMGTIANENDSSDEEDQNDSDKPETDSEYEEQAESEEEDEDVISEDDSENEELESDSEDEDAVHDSASPSGSTSKGEFEKFSKSFEDITLTRNVGKEPRIKNVKNKSKTGKSDGRSASTSKVEFDKETSDPGKFVKSFFSKSIPENEKLGTDTDQKETGDKKSGDINIPDEYDTDTSDEEDIRNTVGNVPMSWYEDYSHLGYDWDGKKVIKPPQGDELDNFLRKMEDPNFWRTVKDPQTGQDVVLCDADADLIARLQKHKIPDPEFDEYAPWIEWFSSEVMQMPLRKFPEHKRSFVPSKDEARKVSRIVHAIKMGWIKPKQEKSKEPQFYMLWETDDASEHMRRIHNHIPAPKRHLPNHAESYNPPPEYLFDKPELKQWKGLKNTPWKRKVHFIPQKYGSLREVPAYDRYIKERFLRCLDLYLCPRARKMRLLIQPEDLVPQLPNPKDLQPFPTTLSLVYKGHTDMVRTITVEPKGQYLASGSDDLTVKIWEVATGRCVRTIPAGGIVRSVSWCPNPALSLLAIAADRKLLLVNPDVGDLLVVKKTDTLLEEPPEQDVLVAERVKSAVQWEQAAGEEWKKGVRIIINHFKEIKQVTWHGRGDYFATVMAEAQNRSVIIHQISKRRSQIPFNRSKGLVQCVLFHPIRPIFFVATQKNVRVYDLVKQEIVKKLLSNAKWISTMAVHPGGDNLLVATYDRKILWFDLDLSTKPYQTLRLHGLAVRGVAYHKRYPLFASGSDDNSVIVSHGMVYNDLLQNPLIVPLKRMSYHEKINDFSIFDVVFHPSQPWLFSSGADGSVRLYT